MNVYERGNKKNQSTVKFLIVYYVKRQSNNIWFVSVNKIIIFPLPLKPPLCDLKFTELATYFEDVYLPLFAILGRHTNLFGCPLLPLNTATAPKSDGFYIFLVNKHKASPSFTRGIFDITTVSILYLPHTRHTQIVNGWQCTQGSTIYKFYLFIYLNFRSLFIWHIKGHPLILVLIIIYINFHSWSLYNNYSEQKN